ncbi:MAG TPA: nuclear transport factor 2 family protein [Actinoplanes sp.]
MQTAGSAAVTPAAAGTSAAEESAAGGTVAGLEQRNIATIRRMYADVLSAADPGRVGAYFARDLIQHDPAITDGIAGMVDAVRRSRAQDPRPVPTIKHVLADGNLVAVHAHVSATPQNEASGRATIALYRLAGNRIVEQWAFAQDVPATSVSGNSMFSDLYRYDTTPPPVSAERQDANKQLVIKAWGAAFTARDLSVLDRYWAAGNGYLQHNPRVPNGTDGLRRFLSTLPSSVSHNRFALADGDLVLTINHNVATSQNLDSDMVGSAVADLYRVVGSTIVEHWDVVQPVATTSANGNSMFSSRYSER